MALRSRKRKRGLTLPLNADRAQSCTGGRQAGPCSSASTRAAFPAHGFVAGFIAEAVFLLQLAAGPRGPRRRGEAHPPLGRSVIQWVELIVQPERRVEGSTPTRRGAAPRQDCAARPAVRVQGCAGVCRSSSSRRARGEATEGTPAGLQWGCTPNAAIRNTKMGNPSTSPQASSSVGSSCSINFRRSLRGQKRDAPREADGLYGERRQRSDHGGTPFRPWLVDTRQVTKVKDSRGAGPPRPRISKSSLGVPPKAAVF